MRYLILFCFSWTSFFVHAQTSVVLTKGKVPLINVFNPDSLKNYNSAIFGVASMPPLPSGIDPQIKYQANQEREAKSHNQYPSSAKRSALAPQLQNGFEGAFNAGTPNDNNMAINNDSFIVSVLNTNIRVYNSSGDFLKNWSLEFFPRDPNATQPDGNIAFLDRSYDPKIVFDPVSDRFIIVYLEGSLSEDTRIIVAFSKSSNPLQGWNVYQLNGNPFSGSFWTDYPMIAINGEDLFITVNILKDNTDWREGFTQSVIWQLPKKNGYQADTMPFNLWSNILHQGKPIWSICPVQDAFQPGQEGLYFLSVRPGAKSNDTVFLHNINHNYSHGNPTYSYKVMKSDKVYGLPPEAPQKQLGFRLQTNDARVLGAFYVNNKIQYVQTSMNPINGRSSVYHGTVQFPDNLAPEVKANIISYDSLDIAYPTIVSAGNQIFGRQSLITFSHSGETIFPGTSIVYYDNNGEYSDLLMLKKGDGYINSFIADTAERWGDYTCIQKRYNKNNEFWVVGSYGRNNNTVGTWISQVSVNDPQVSIQTETKFLPAAFPNPVSEILSLPFELRSAATITISITDVSGRVVFTIESNGVAGLQKAFINTSTWAQGLYFYTVSANQQLINHGSFSKQ